MHRTATLSALLTIGLLTVSALAGPETPWTVDELPGPSTQANLDLTEGTWLGVDVHPDGDRVLFDLLGDLYVVPMTGGPAARITEGAAWDTEGRWSPDGNELLFTSDRDGNRNLWLAQADGSKARPLTTEADTRISDAAWLPDGEGVVARKRFTDTSSIGLHELWLFDRYGGKGVALTKKEATAGLSEPSVSPDGRHVYFSARDARYRYDRDPNRGIWDVRRLDRVTGTIRPLTGEFGGAVRPTPSPDGRTLAIVRRVRATTQLELYDLETGARTTIADWLSRDEQEGFAVSGLYPRIDWTPDGQRIVLWAQGGLWSVDVSTGDRTAIPFEVKASLAVTDAARAKRSPVSDAVEARLIRWPTVAPGGDRVAFSALGSLWTQSLDGAAKRLTAEDHREYAPAWSPDGRWLVWVSWDDARGGAIHVRNAGGGKVRTVGPVGPKYSNPSFSPDGRSIVLLRGSGTHARGGDLASELWSDIITLDLDSGAVAVVTETAGLKRAARPVFSADGRRVLFPEERAVPLNAEDGVLYSVNLDGSDRRIVLEVGKATDVAPSPDGRWVAFQEAHHAWVARIPSAGKGPLTVAREGGGVPVWRLSEEAGDWVGFSADGQWVSWNHGADLHTLRLDELLDWQSEQQEEARQEAEAAAAAAKEVAEDSADAPAAADVPAAADAPAEDDAEDADEEPALPPSTVTKLEVLLPRAAPSGAVAITGARVVTMDGDTVLEGATILTRDDRIAAVGPDGSVQIPGDAHVVDGAGMTVLPGLIDVHAHLHFSALDTMPEQDWRYIANLAYGVTTVHDPSVFTDQAFVYAELVEAGLMIGPRVFSTGEILYGAAGSYRSAVANKDDAFRHVRRMKKLGAISVKSYQQPRRDQRQWIIEAGIAEDILVVPEGGGDTLGNLTMIVDGHSAIEHALPTTPLHQDIVGLFAASGTFYTPTLLVAYGGLMGEHFFYSRTPVWENERLLKFTPQGVIDARSRRLRAVASDDDWHHQDVAVSAAAVQRAGGKVTLGGHGQLQGLGSHWELWALAGPGAMTPLEALRSATIHGAEYLGMEEDLGSLEAGKLADFFVVEGDPTTTIEDSDNLRWTVKNGVLYDAGTMDRVWPDPAPAPALIHEVARGDIEGGCAAEH